MERASLVGGIIMSQFTMQYKDKKKIYYKRHVIKFYVILLIKNCKIVYI